MTDADAPADAQEQGPAFTPPPLGALAPWFITETESNPTFHLHTLGGRWLLLVAMTPGRETSITAAIATHRGLFDDNTACVFGVLTDPTRFNTYQNDPPGVRYFRDRSGEITQWLGVDGVALLDHTLRVAWRGKTDAMHAALTAVSRAAQIPPVNHAPVLLIPRILEPGLCKALIAHYQAGDSQSSGFMREVNGVTMLLHDSNHKVRKDVTITDQALKSVILDRITHRLLPMVERAFAWRATRIERHIVACYSAEDGGHFNPHRDNTTKGTAHRKFAVTMNLNAEDYEGGDLRFPEFGPNTYRAPTGGAVVFSCSLLHEATQVTEGVRYAYVPFLYDEAGASLREANLAHVEERLKNYKA
jgi:predicted 2-oxoglutarate/Fe(II)-dependent dioxygenase YbiX